MKKKLVLAFAVLGLCVSMMAPKASFAKKGDYTVTLWDPSTGLEIEEAYQGQLVCIEIWGEDVLEDPKKAEIKVKITGEDKKDGKHTINGKTKFMEDAPDLVWSDFCFVIPPTNEITADTLEVTVWIKGEGKVKESWDIVIPTVGD